MLNDFHFLRPEWFIALPFIALLLILLLKRSKKNNNWETLCDAQLLQFQLAQNSVQQNHTFKLLHWAIPLLFFITIMALAGPSWEKKEQPVFQQGNALVMILDLSLSMNAKDIKPSRLERSKLKLIDILKQKTEGQTALIAFAGDSHTVSPLTIDNKTIISLLPALSSSIMPLPGSHLVDALNNAGQLFKNAGFAQGDILLFSDGLDPAQQSRVEKTVKVLSQQGYRFSIIGVGTQTGSPIPLPGQSGFIKDPAGQVILSKLSAAPLKKLASIGNGSYHKLSLDDSDFKALLNQHQYNDKAQLEQKDQIEQWYDAGVYLCLLLLPLALLGFRKGLLSVLPLIFLAPCFVSEPLSAAEPDPIPENAQSNSHWQQSWKKLWATPDQQAQKAFRKNDYQYAAHNFTNNDWKASALYRNGKFDQALKYYSQSDTAQNLYNKGNTLANMGQFIPAKEAYEQALKKQPDFSAAEKNRAYMEELIKQQKQQEQQQPQKNSDNKEDKKQDKSDNQNQDQKNSSDEKTSKSNESDSQESKENNSDDSESEGSQSAKKDQEKTSAEQSEHDKSPEQDQEHNTPSKPQKNEQQDKDQQIKQPSQAASAIMEEQEKARKKAKEQEEKQQSENNNQPSGSDKSKADILSQLSQEERQSLKQWLQRIPDNPGQLLKVKFRNNTLIRQKQMDKEDYYEGEPW